MTFRLAALPLVLVIALAACGGGGGGRDLTVLGGNVRGATGGSAALPSRSWLASLGALLWPEAVAQVPGITVALANTTRSTETDEGGFFRMEVGQFGETTILFSGEGVSAGRTVVLPFGGTFQMVDIDIDGGDVTVGEEQITFEGPITAVDCNQQLLVVTSGGRLNFRVRIGGAILRNESGEEITCGQIILGQEAEVFAVVEQLETVIATEVQLDPDRVPPPTVTPTSPPSATATTAEAVATATPTATPPSTPTATPTAG